MSQTIKFIDNISSIDKSDDSKNNNEQALEAKQEKDTKPRDY